MFEREDVRLTGRKSTDVVQNALREKGIDTMIEEARRESGENGQTPSR